MANKKVKKRLTNDQITHMREMKNNGKSRKEISLFFNVSPQTVNKHVGYFGRRGGRNKTAPEIVEEIRDLRQKGTTRKDVAKRLGLSTSTISTYAKGYARAKHDKITEEKIEKVRTLADEGYSRKKISEKMNISYSNVSYFTKGIKPDIDKVRNGKIVGYFSKEAINIVGRFEEKGYMDRVSTSTIITLLKFFPELNWISTSYGGRIAFIDKGKEDAFLHYINKITGEGRAYELSNIEIKKLARKFGI